MLIIKTAGDHRDVGEMVCHWKEDAALATIRSFLGIGCRMFFSRVKPKGASGSPDETKIQEALDRYSVKALAMIEDYAADVFLAAQSQLICEITIKLIEEIMRDLTITARDDSKGLATHPLIDPELLRGFLRGVKKGRKGLLEGFKTRHNNLMGIRPGRQVGQKDARPRSKRAASASTNRKEKILAAMGEIGRPPFHRREVARRIGISTKTLGTWVSKEEWEFLTVEALSIGSQK
jgi:hypothetical protein